MSGFYFLKSHTKKQEHLKANEKAQSTEANNNIREMLKIM